MIMMVQAACTSKMVVLPYCKKELILYKDHIHLCHRIFAYILTKTVSFLPTVSTIYQILPNAKPNIKLNTISNMVTMATPHINLPDKPALSSLPARD